MTERKTEKLELDNLELNRETIQDLTESQAEGVEGGFMTITKTCPPPTGLATDCGPYVPHVSDNLRLDCVQRGGR